jgi:L-threonylcarbamoyladenylate synthase
MGRLPDVITSAERRAVQAAARLLAGGGVVVYPTETLYALGVDACNPRALQRLIALKAREPGKPIAVLVSDQSMLREIADEVSGGADALMRRFWPGPLTIVLRARPTVSEVLTAGSGGIGVRVSSHPLAAELVRRLGRPVTAPSANPAGRRPPACVEDARAYFGARVDDYLAGGRLPGEPPSTVVDMRDDLRIIRAGAVSADALRACLHEAA